ncbi:MAG: GNAT family N-acetyltransferase [Candidatus Limousia pullorum]|nr:GNAT family N-acetyltransferase [Candidatus Limousia pullorum]
MIIRKIENTERKTAVALMWDTFLKFEAPDYSFEGVNAFRSFIFNDKILDTLEIFGAYEKEKLLGVIATNQNRKHICCFFVEADSQRKGIGRKLWEYIKKHNQNDVVTVNSSPYAVKVYHKFGFIDTDTEKTTDGIRYTPMKYEMDNGL